MSDVSVVVVTYNGLPWLEQALDSPAYKAKVKAYENREVMMRKQRLTPDFPEWPSFSMAPPNSWAELSVTVLLFSIKLAPPFASPSL